jgi:hypothetical protein
VENNPVNRNDPMGEDSFLVSRPLDGAAGLVASHNFVVSDASFPGDPNATIFSFGNTDAGRVGRVDFNTQNDFSGTTHADDLSYWNSLSRGTNSVTQISAPDSLVQQYGNGVVENLDYSAFAGAFGYNSNSAAQAVANGAAGTEVSTPDGFRFSPGAGGWQDVSFLSTPETICQCTPTNFGGASGGFVLYPSKPNTNLSNSAYRK